MEETIEIGGVQYKQRPRKQQSGKMSRTLMMLSAIAMTCSAFDPISSKSCVKGERPKVNIVKEFELIQLKKSNLSRSNRDWVVRQFNQYFQAVT